MAAMVSWALQAGNSGNNGNSSGERAFPQEREVVYYSRLLNGTTQICSNVLVAAESRALQKALRGGSGSSTSVGWR